MTQEDEDAKTLKLLEDMLRRVVREELERAQVPCIWCRRERLPVPAPEVAGPAVRAVDQYVDMVGGSTTMLYPPGWR